MINLKRLPWGAIATLSGEGLSRLAMSLFQFLVANRLGAAGYGGLAIILSYASILLPIADMGLNSLALRQLANNSDPSVFRKIFALKWGLTGLYFVALALGPLFLNHDAGVWSLAIAGLFFAFTSLSDFMRQTLRAKEASFREFKARLTYLGLFIPGCFIFWVWQPGIPGTLLIYALPVCGLCLVYMRTLLQVFPGLAPDWQGGWSLLLAEKRFLLQAAAYLFLVSASTRIDLWVLDWGMGKAAVGFYFAAYNMVFAGIFFGQALSVHMYPRLHRPGDKKRAFGRALSAHVGLALALILGVLLFGKPVYNLIYRQPGFEHGLVLLPGQSILLGLSILNYLWLSLAIGRNKQWISSLALIFTLAVKTWLGVRWVPQYGALGMLHATLWAEVPATIGSGIILAIHYFRSDGRAIAT